MNNSITAETPLDPASHPRRAVERLSISGFGDVLRKTAAPTFAAMAILCGLAEHSGPISCAALAHSGHFGGMTAMYLLMAVFHLSAWLPRGIPAALQSTSRS